MQTESNLSQTPTVYIVDDDPAARESVSALVQSMGIASRSYASAEAFLVDYDEGYAGCLVTDLRMTGMSGLELQEELDRREIALPVILISAHASVPVAVRSMREGAVTVLEKPCCDQDLWDSIRHAINSDSERRRIEQHREEISQKVSSLSPEEKEVLDGLIAGKLNKVIANELGISLRTVESRRHNIMDKMGASSLAELVRMIVEVEQSPESQNLASMPPR